MYPWDHSRKDLAGPFLSYSQHHKRTTVKIWLIVFCCVITNAVKIMVITPSIFHKVCIIKGDLDVLDLITPNRLLMGRNNDWSPSGILEVSGDYDKVLRGNKKIFESWFECWLTAHFPTLMYQPKWLKFDGDLQVGDVALFAKQESVSSSSSIGWSNQ